MIFSNFNGTKSGGPLSWGTRLMEKVILGVGKQCKVQFSLESRIAQLNQSISSKKNTFYSLFSYYSVIPTPWRFE